MTDKKRPRLSLPAVLTLGGMITMGIITTTLGFVLWPEPRPHHDISTEGWPQQPVAPTAPIPPAMPTIEIDAGTAPQPDIGDNDPAKVLKN
ncbi:MAG: hypothetical protein MJE77_28350 [Proteobacteria bacterium]|nr:hypothetical protein [Pseudomonadota bacterium]